MSGHSKKYNTLDEMLIAAQAMVKFQSMHNEIRNDYLELLKVTENNKQSEVTFNALYRACLRSLFSLIESDIYGLNKLDKYEKYDDKDSVIKKFKETYKQISKTWSKKDIQNKYFDSKLQGLGELKKMRDELVHPKEIEHIHKATEVDFDKLKLVFNDYDVFINELMNDFFLSASIPFTFP